VVLLLAPVPPRLKEWAYAGLAIDLASALPLESHQPLIGPTRGKVESQSKELHTI